MGVRILSIPSIREARPAATITAEHRGAGSRSRWNKVRRNAIGFPPSAKKEPCRLLLRFLLGIVPFSVAIL